MSATYRHINITEGFRDGVFFTTVQVQAKTEVPGGVFIQTLDEVTVPSQSESLETALDYIKLKWGVD